MGNWKAGIKRVKLGPARGTITAATALMFMLLLLAVIIAFYNVNRYINVVTLGRKIAFENIILIHRAISDACCGGVGGSRVIIFVPKGSTIVFSGNELKVEGVDTRGLYEEAIKNYLKTYSRGEALSIDVEVGENYISIRYTSAGRAVEFSHEEIRGGIKYTITILCLGFYKVKVLATPSG